MGFINNISRGAAAGANPIVCSLGEPTAFADATTKNYVDSS